EPAFHHHKDLPSVTGPGLVATVFMGALDGARSPAWTASPLVGAELRLEADADVSLAVQREFEHAVLPVSGEVTVDGRAVERGTLVYLGTDRSVIRLGSTAGGTALLLGGYPFEEQLVMWWNFVGRTHE